ncbi:hypothetical protein FJTKL_12173 [Diaporthe vaccinii]|uniref:Uncharacterized protein n=1 Tax=Diaporthe vaccinii TaxID=105482 RepID=A0ABR4EEL6_9PEZI
MPSPPQYPSARSLAAKESSASEIPSPPLTIAADATTSREHTASPTWSSSRFGTLEQDDLKNSGSAGPVSCLGSFVAVSTTPQTPTSPSHLPTPHPTPGSSSSKSDPGAKTLPSDLHWPPEASGSLLPSALPRNSTIQDTEPGPYLSALQATSKLVTSSLNLSELSLPSLEQDSSEEASFPGLFSSIARFFRHFQSTNILASTRVQKARKAHGRVQAVLRLIKARQAGKYLGPQLAIRRRLFSSEYRELIALIEADENLSDYFYQELCFDYSHTTHYFTFYMVTELHDNFVLSMFLKVEAFLNDNKGSDCKIIGEIAKGLKKVGSGTVIPAELEYDGKQPDMAWRFLPSDETSGDSGDNQYPGLVIEVAWAQEKHKLKEKAKYYFEATGGQIRTLVGINLNDICRQQSAAEKKWDALEGKWKKDAGKPRPEPLTFLAPAAASTPATFSVWRAEYDSHTDRVTFGEHSVEDQVRL